jgi:glycosyltransferase involved in cell wall biosynthesis
MREPRKIKVAMVTSGGFTRKFRSWPELALSRELIKYDIDIAAFTSKYVVNAFGEKETDIIDGIPVYRFWGKRKHFSDILSFIQKLISYNPDIVHIHFPSYLNELADKAYIVAKVLRRPYVITVHGLLHDPYIVENLDNPFEEKIDFDKAIKSILELVKGCKFIHTDARINYLSHIEIINADKVIALSKFERELLLKLGVNINKIKVIPNGIDYEYYAKNKIPKDIARKRLLIEPNIRIVLYFGALVKRKGVHYLIEAIPQVLKEHKNVVFYLAGHVQEEREYLIKRAKELNIVDKIRIEGPVSEERKLILFSSADIFVFPTLYEGFGIPIIEAMAFGLPVISTNIPVINEIVTEDVGLLVKPKDPIALADAISKLLSEDEDHLRNMSTKAQLVVKDKYDWRNIAKEYLGIYHEVLAK